MCTAAPGEVNARPPAPANHHSPQHDCCAPTPRVRDGMLRRIEAKSKSGCHKGSEKCKVGEKGTEHDLVTAYVACSFRHRTEERVTVVMVMINVHKHGRCVQYCRYWI
ncbi:hypothetical protein E2C01_083609 [Portunus trituberculatus]|uniref:Uncharacterized protein n=1 Tax=Portunus trituberculatus TaxID=210409 RepID=A0A5B7IVM1_PORTR|nr:hypothetical protein [Portunus trituberculatus]